MNRCGTEARIAGRTIERCPRRPAVGCPENPARNHRAKEGGPAPRHRIADIGRTDVYVRDRTASRQRGAVFS